MIALQLKETLAMGSTDQVATSVEKFVRFCRILSYI